MSCNECPPRKRQRNNNDARMNHIVSNVNSGDLSCWLNEKNLDQDFVAKLQELGVVDVADLQRNLHSESDINSLLNELDVTGFFIRKKFENALMELTKGKRKKKVEKIDLDQVNAPRLNNKDDRYSAQLNRNRKNELYQKNEYNPHSNNMNNNICPKYVNDLSVNEKRELISNFNLLCGIYKDKNGRIQHKAEPIFKLIKSNNNYNNNFIQQNLSRIEIKESHSSSFTEYAKSGYFGVAAEMEASYNGLFVSGGVKASTSKSSSSSSHQSQENEKYTYIAEGVHCRGNIILDSYSFVLTDSFQHDIKTMNKNDLYSKYGEFVRLNVVFGAKVYSIKQVSKNEAMNSTKKKEDFEASFAMKVQTLGFSASGGGSVNKGNEEQKQDNKSSKDSYMKLEAFGGDTHLAQQNDWSQWTKSINYKNWAIIDTQQIRDITKLHEFSAQSVSNQIFEVLGNVLGVNCNAKQINLDELKRNYIDNSRKVLDSEKLLIDFNSNKMEDNEYSNNIKCGGIDINEIKGGISDEIKLKLICNLSLLYGRTLDKNGDVTESEYPIFEIRDLSKIQCNEINKIYQITKIASSQTQKQLATKGYSVKDKNITTDLSLNYYGLNVANIGGGYDSKNDENKESSKYKKYEEHWFVANHNYPKLKIKLNERWLKLTDEYIDDYTKLKTRDKSMTFPEFHRKYGNWVDLEIIIGGKVFSSKSKCIADDEQIYNEKNQFEDAFKAKINLCVATNIEASKGSAEGNKNISKNQNKQNMNKISLQVTGGIVNNFNMNNYTKWEKSLNDYPEKWTVIQINNTSDILQLIHFIKKDYPETIKIINQPTDPYKVIEHRIKWKWLSPQKFIKYENNRRTMKVLPNDIEYKQIGTAHIDDILIKKNEIYLFEFRYIKGNNMDALDAIIGITDNKFNFKHKKIQSIGDEIDCFNWGLRCDGIICYNNDGTICYKKICEKWKHDDIIGILIDLTMLQSKKSVIRFWINGEEKFVQLKLSDFPDIQLPFKVSASVSRHGGLQIIQGIKI